MTGRLPVAVVARDPGAAAALAPVARALKKAHVSAAICALTPAAAAAFERARVPSVSTTVLQADVVLSGTSTKPGLDADLWRRARLAGSRVIAVVDHWTALADRFGAGRPDLICVIDEECRSVLLHAGVSDDAVVAVGHPALDEVAETAGPRVPGGDGCVAFVSEPLSLLSKPPPIDERRGAAILGEALAESPAPLVVRAHPREDPGEVAQRFEPWARGRVETLLGDPLPRLADVSAVVGMGSMLLVEVALLGVPVAALRIEDEARRFPGSAIHGLVTTISSATECLGFLRAAPDNPADPERVTRWRAKHGIDGAATERVVAEVFARL